ncbi:MAG: hypothetical protein AMJ81_07380 [Phycisphaerae bacterium SM23_33]|nr:MAG: hypothetical protein AMJ81_07380 [Phycisphaerae bacterium SM23_33]
MRHGGTILALLPAAGLVAGLSLMAVCPAAGQSGRQEMKISPIEAARMMVRQGDYLKVRYALLAMLYRTTDNFEAEYLLGRCQEGLGEKQRAVVMYQMCLRTIREAGKQEEPEAVKMAADCRGRLKRLDTEGPRLAKAYLATAAGKKFVSPEQVSDLWMTQVTVTKLTLEMLGHPGAFVLDAIKKGWQFDRNLCAYVQPPPGGETNFKSPYTLKGPQPFAERHASGAAFVEAAGGRKGILKTNPNWKEKKPARLTMRNTGKGNFLRIGTSPAIWSCPTCEVAASQDKADFVLNVRVGEKLLLTQAIAGRRWTDLKVDLGEFRGKDVEVVVENAAGGRHPYYEGAYFDYVDFFED